MIDNNIDRDPNTIDWINNPIKAANHLNPIKHPQQDFFIADIFDAISWFCRIKKFKTSFSTGIIH